MSRLTWWGGDGGDGVKGGRKKEEEYREIEKFYSIDCPKIPELSPEEKLILTAKPTDKDIDRSFVKWDTEETS